jgi:hypothetical protein
VSFDAGRRGFRAIPSPPIPGRAGLTRGTTLNPGRGTLRRKRPPSDAEIGGVPRVNETPRVRPTAASASDWHGHMAWSLILERRFRPVYSPRRPARSLQQTQEQRMHACRKDDNLPFGIGIPFQPNPVLSETGFPSSPCGVTFKNNLNIRNPPELEGHQDLPTAGREDDRSPTPQPPRRGAASRVHGVVRALRHTGATASQRCQAFHSREVLLHFVWNLWLVAASIEQRLNLAVV